MKVQKFILRLFLLSIVFATSSCSEFFREKFGRNDENTPPQIRIVDLSGKPKPIKTFIPEGNVQALSEQQRSPRQDNPARTQSAMIPEVPYVAQNDLSTIPAPVTASTPILEQDQNVVKDSEVVVSYDMSNDEKVTEEVKNVEVQNIATEEKSSARKYKFISQKVEAPQEIKSAKTPAKSAAKKSSGSQIFVQIGSFSTRDSALEVLNKNSGISSGKIQEANIAGRTNYRVLLGPSFDGQSAKQILTQARNAGYNDAFIAK